MAHDSQSIDSLYDFLYLDRGRLSAFMAQVFDDGVLTSSKKTEQTSDTNGGQVEGSLHFFKGNARSQTANTTSQEMQFDASWTLPLNVLDGLDAHGFIGRGIDEARIGQLRLVSGRVSILDIKLLQQMWAPLLEVILKQLGLNNKQVGATRAEYKNIGQVLEKLPQAVQMHLTTTAGDQAWMTLNGEFMVISPDEIALKHGSSIPGEWHVLGVIDALPEGEEVSVPVAAEGLMEGMFGMLGMVRETAGRPKSFYGMTPILIFRQIDRA